MLKLRYRRKLIAVAPVVTRSFFTCICILYIYIYINLYLYVCIYTYIYIYTHTGISAGSGSRSRGLANSGSMRRGPQTEAALREFRRPGE